MNLRQSYRAVLPHRTDWIGNRFVHCCDCYGRRAIQFMFAFARCTLLMPEMREKLLNNAAKRGRLLFIILSLLRTC